MIDSKIDDLINSEEELQFSHFVPCVLPKDPSCVNKHLVFTDDSGPMFLKILTLLDIFSLFIKELIDRIAFETNLYATQKFREGILPINSEEIHSFLGVNLIIRWEKKQVTVTTDQLSNK